MSTDPVTPQILTTSIKETTTTELPNEKDLDRIAPCFFVGPHETEEHVSFEPELSQDSGSAVGYGDRRLSGILAEVKINKCCRYICIYTIQVRFTYSLLFF